MIDTASLNANELVSKLKSGEISSVELCKAYIKRIEKFDKDVQAWAFLDKKILLEKAEEASKNNYRVMKLSGTEFRKKLRSGETIPEWFAFKSVVDVLRES